MFNRITEPIWKERLTRVSMEELVWEPIAHFRLVYPIIREVLG